MKQYFKKRFALTDAGARDLQKSTIASFLVYCVNMAPAIIVMLLVDELLLNNAKDTWVYLLISGLTLVAMFALLMIEYETLFNATYKESANLRIGMAERLSKLPLSYFSKHDLSDLAQTIMSDIEAIEHAISHSLPKVAGMMFFFPLISLFMLLGNVKLALAAIIPTIISFLLIPLSKKLQVYGHNKYYRCLRENSEMFQETIEMQQEIKSFHLSEETKSTLYRKMEESEVIHIKSEAFVLMTISLSAIFSFISLAAVILVGADLVLRGEITVLYLIGYFLAAIKLKDALDVSKEGIMEIFYLDPRIKRIEEIMNSEIQEGKDVDLQSFDITLENVAFAYEKDTPVLKDVSFTAKQGEVTALVGVSGCGKTSILRLVSRLYDYDRGKIRIDGKDIKEISAKSLFEKVSIVFQDVTLFNTSVMENIRIGRQNAADEEVKRAAQLAGCEEFILKMEKGYDTLIGENGAELSGGERQRLSIARAFLKDAPILILDEISASLDVDNEKKIQDSLNKLIQNKTVLIISHRLKSVEKVDKIVVIDDGKVAEEGNHQELLSRSKIYANLIQKTKMAEDFVY